MGHNGAMVTPYQWGLPDCKGQCWSYVLNFRVTKHLVPLVLDMKLKHNDSSSGPSSVTGFSSWLDPDVQCQHTIVGALRSDLGKYRPRTGKGNLKYWTQIMGKYCRRSRLSEIQARHCRLYPLINQLNIIMPCLLLLNSTNSQTFADFDAIDTCEFPISGPFR